MIRQPSQRLLAGLLASCALNVFLGGLLIGGSVRGHPILGRADKVGGPPPGLEWVRRVLGPGSVPALDGVSIRHGDALRERAFDLREARREVDHRLEAGRYDSAALAAALDDVGRRSTALQAELATALVELAADLTPAQRRLLVEARRAPPATH